MKTGTIGNIVFALVLAAIIGTASVAIWKTPTRTDRAEVVEKTSGWSSVGYETEMGWVEIVTGPDGTKWTVFTHGYASVLLREEKPTAER